MIFTACSADGGGEGPPPGGPPSGGPPPEDKPVKDRWGKWVDESSTATLVYSVDDDGVCTITVGGKADVWDRWKANAWYDYTSKAGKRYVYTFEAWIQSGTREIDVEYNIDKVNEIYYWDSISLTNKRKTYTLYGNYLSNNTYNGVAFLCADKLGTFYVKVLEIKEYTTGTLTITNFSGIPDLAQNNWLYVNAAKKKEEKELLFAARPSLDGGYNSEQVQIKGNTISIPVWRENSDDDTFIPFTGNTIVPVGELRIWSSSSDDTTYISTVPITFTNGNATINFKTK